VILRTKTESKFGRRYEAVDKTIVTILVLYYLAMFGLAFIAQRRTGSTEDFYIASGKIGPWLTVGTYFATFVSAGLVVSWVSLANLWGMYFIWSGVGVSIAALVNWALFGGKIMKYTKESGATSLLDVLDLRYKSKNLRIVTAAVMLIFMLPLMATQFTVGGLLIEMVAGIPYSWSVIVMGVAVFLYVAYGGYLAVVYTDNLQGGLMFIGTAALLFLVLGKVGGLGQLATSYTALNPAGAVGWPSAAANSIVSGRQFFAWVMLAVLGGAGSPYLQVRFMSLKNKKAYRNGFFMAAIIIVLAEFMIPFIGMGGRVLFPELANNPDITTFTLIKHLFPGIGAGLLMAAITAAMMSTIDSILLVCATTVEHDILKRGIGIEVTPKQRVWLARAVTVVIGTIAVVWGLNPPKLVAMLFYPAFGVLGLVFIVLFGGAFFWSRFNSWGAIAATVVAPAVFVTWSRCNNPFGIRDIEITIVCTILAAIVGSYLGPAPSQDIIRRFFPHKAQVTASDQNANLD
jgi:sodium/proline symporter